MDEWKDLLEALNTSTTGIPIVIIGMILQTFQSQEKRQFFVLLFAGGEWTQIVEESEDEHSQFVRCSPQQDLLDDLFGGHVIFDG